MKTCVNITSLSKNAPTPPHVDITILCSLKSSSVNVRLTAESSSTSLSLLLKEIDAQILYKFVGILFLLMLELLTNRRIALSIELMSLLSESKRAVTTKTHI